MRDCNWRYLLWDRNFVILTQYIETLFSSCFAFTIFPLLHGVSIFDDISPPVSLQNLVLSGSLSFLFHLLTFSKVFLVFVHFYDFLSLSFHLITLFFSLYFWSSPIRFIFYPSCHSNLAFPLLFLVSFHNKPRFGPVWHSWLDCCLEHFSFRS